MSTHAATEDVFAGSEDDKADRVYLAQGGDWSDIASEQAERGDEKVASSGAEGLSPRGDCASSAASGKAYSVLGRARSNAAYSAFSECVARVGLSFTRSDTVELHLVIGRHVVKMRIH